MLIAAAVPSNLLISALVVAILFGLGRVIIQRVAYAEANPWLVRILTIALVLHLLAAPAQIFVVDHFYHGIADWTRYVGQGARSRGTFASSTSPRLAQMSARSSTTVQ